VIRQNVRDAGHVLRKANNMNILHKFLLCRKHTVKKESTSGLILPEQTETLYEVVLAGPKVVGLTAGQKVKPFKYADTLLDVEHEGETLYLLNQDQIQDIA